MREIKVCEGCEKESDSLRWFWGVALCKSCIWKVDKFIREKIKAIVKDEKA